MLPYADVCGAHAGAPEREELVSLCKCFYANQALLNSNSNIKTTPAAAAIGGAGAGGGAAAAGGMQAAGLGVMGVGGGGGGGGGGGLMVGRPIAEFSADYAIYLVEAIRKFPRGKAGTEEQQEWELNLIVGIKVLTYADVC
jgi:hypothetical protein